MDQRTGQKTGQRTETAGGREYWRSLEELAGAPGFEERLRSEFPRETHHVDFASALDRREFLRLMGASLALAGAAGCTSREPEKIVPYVRAPEEIVPGQALHFATAIPLGGVAQPVLVQSQMGRPVKIEGNPEHPESLGSTDVFTQAAILGLYDPDRSKAVIHLGNISTWTAFLAEARLQLEGQRAKRGSGLRLLTETVTSPTLAAQIRDLLKDYPEARWHQYEPLHRDSALAGAIQAFGEMLETQLRVAEADVILSLESDFLSSGPGSVRHARDFSARRAPKAGGPGEAGKGAEGRRMNRLYAVESTPSLTGVMADHRLRLGAGLIEALALAVIRELGVEAPAPAGTVLPDEALAWARIVAKDLRQRPGASLVVAGDSQPPNVHALAHAINAALGNAGKTVLLTDPIEAEPVLHVASIRELAADMEAGKVEVLVIAGGNPVYSAPADLRFETLLRDRVRFKVHLGLYEDETSFNCQWHLPECHALESWGDARAADGTVTILQPLILPLYGGKTAHELIALLKGQERPVFEIVQEAWKAHERKESFELFFRRSIHDGFVAGSASPSRSVTLKRDFLAPRTAPAAPAGGFEVVYRPDPSVWDGRFANNAWLQELPRHFSKLTWDNVALLSPADAARLGLENGDAVELRLGGRSTDRSASEKVPVPVWIQPGQADGTVALQLGYGRTRAGKVGSRVGFNAFLLRTTLDPWSAVGLEVLKTGEKFPLAATQSHHLMENRDLVRVETLEELLHEEAHRNDAEALERAREQEREHETSLHPGFPTKGNAWGMSIDLNLCTGCNACMVACQAENNIPVVGKDQVARGREMGWIRIDHYFQGSAESPGESVHQPVPCMQCEQAPCETVCPTGATVHTHEGLNDMVYNRCLGTRYCGNNCPYKVRRFNFFQYADWATESLKLLRNPEVSVRSRGVMEKCTYCIQRISAVRIAAKKDGRPIADGEIQTACMQVCPSRAIVFGDLQDPASRVAALKKDPRSYGLLEELNTRPRTTYLAKVRNPNPEMPRPQATSAEVRKA